MSSPIAQIREIVAEHESDHAAGTMVVAPSCNCMERIAYIMQVFYPAGVEFLMVDDE